jgi:hypothetical protein
MEAHRTDSPPIGRRQPRYEGQRLQGVALPFDKLFSFLKSNKHCTKTLNYCSKDLLFLFCFFLVKSCLDKSFSQTNAEAQHWSNMGVLKFSPLFPTTDSVFHPGLSQEQLRGLRWLVIKRVRSVHSGRIL